MGKPFEKELASLELTYQHVNSAEIGEFKDKVVQTLRKPLYIIGSGGSLSACYYAEMLHQQCGMIAKAITPLEAFYLNRNFHQSNVLILTASGRNKDILFAFDQALYAEPDSIISICSAKNSSLAKKAKKYSIAPVFEFPIPTGSDGFLASNSLIAFFSILANAYNFTLSPTLPSKKEIFKFEDELKWFLSSIDINNSTFHVLYGGWGKPVAIDIESKFTEAALANTLLADYRNFGHGRHHWFDKKKKDSAIILLTTPEEEQLANKTTLQLPKDIPILKISTGKKGAISSIDLLVKSFYLVKAVGQLRGIDPGKPGVPAFGSKLYHLSYASFLTKNQSSAKTPYLEIQRKIWPQSISEISKSELKNWEAKYYEFTERLQRTRFGGVILDYDRTLCSDGNRLTGPGVEIANELLRVIKAGFLVGVVTGRGTSVRTDLRKIIAKKYWKNVFVGYYNGSQIASLSNDTLPDKSEGADPIFLEIRKLLKDADLGRHVEITQRALQLTIESSGTTDWDAVKEMVCQKAMLVRASGFSFLESSRSIDIVKRPEVSKLNMIEYLQNELQLHQLPKECLCIGDKGRWPGNDFELLSSSYSLSVNEVSFDPASCWNLAPLGLRNTDACFKYLKAIRLRSKYFNFSVK